MSKHKKRKKAPTPHKPRVRAVECDFGAPVSLDEVRISKDGLVEFRSSGEVRVPVQAHTEIAYERAKGKKVQSRAWTEGTKVTWHPDQIVASAERVYWIDTSSRNHSGERVHATAMLIGRAVRSTETRGEFVFGLPAGLEFRGEVEKPEAFAWAEVIERIHRSSGRPRGGKILVVVDAELNLLASINARRIPVWGEYYLPANFSLIYASADVGKSELLNRLMRRCDRESRSLMDTVIRDGAQSTDPFEPSLVCGPVVREWHPVGPPAA